MAKNQKKFLDASGVTHLAKMLDNYPDNEILGTVIDSIQGELEKKAEKSEIPEVPVQDVQVNGTSILSNGVANIPMIGYDHLGVAKLDQYSTYGIGMREDGNLQVVGANDAQYKMSNSERRPVMPTNQHKSVFYGLAKAAGDTTQAASDNAVGTYTSEAKYAIQSMFNVPSRTDTVLDTTLSRGRANSTIGEGSYAFGYNVIASGNYSHAEGYGTNASGALSHAEGNSTRASNTNSHAEGYGATASGAQSHAEGAGTNAIGDNSHAEGAGTTASGDYSHAEGTNTTASGQFSHAEGYNATASGDYSHAEGRGTKAIKDNSHAEGGGTTASGVSSHAEGGGSTASGEQSHAEGGGSQAQGKNSHAEGGGTTATGQNAHSEGGGSQATGSSSHAEGQGSKANAEAAHAEGNMTEATVFGAHAEGNYTKAKGNSSHAEGYSSIAEGELAHAEGYQTCARGKHSHAEGHNSYGTYSRTYSVNGQSYSLIYGAHGEGDHSEGYDTIADSSLSITLTDSYGAHAEGVGTIAITNAQHAQGKWNVPDVNLADVVGNGTEETRSNAYALDWSGNGRFAGNVYVGCGADSSGGTMLPKDVQVNGTSIVSNGVANIPVADYTTFGVLKVGDSYTGLQKDSSGYLKTAPAGSSYIKLASSDSNACIYKPITPYLQHEAVFYGLAKAAGDTTQSASDNAVGVYTDGAKIAIKNMLGITHTLTVTVLTQDNVTVTGQTVTVRANNADGEVYATAAYEGQPVSFSVPDGFSYYVSVSDTLARHFNPTTASGIVSNTDISVTLQYSDFSTIRTAADIKAALNANMDLTDLVGEQITCTKNGETLTWDVVDYDATNGSITLLLHDAFGTANMVFEPAQVLMWCENGLAAGSYTFADGNTHYYFTTSTALPAGGQLRATNTTYYLYASQASTGTLETGTVSTTEIAGATDLGTCAQGLLNHFQRNRYGSNNIAESAIQWWLNSDEAANVQRPFITKFQRPQSYNVPGFMNGLDQDFIDCLDEVDWKCSTNNVYECPKSLGGLTDGTGRAYTIKAKFCLASEMEIFGSYGGNPDGSTVFDLYNGADADDRKKYRGTIAQVWWLRSPHWSRAGHERNVSAYGYAGNSDANGSYAVVPACRISRNSEVTV